jgi:hypothetical protein
MSVKTEKIGYCGINCGGCPAYLATKEDNASKRAEVAKQWSSEEMSFTADDLVCDGCQGPRVFKWAKECPPRTCGVEKGHNTCADCGEYSCEKLESAWKMMGENGDAAKENLESLRG